MRKTGSVLLSLLIMVCTASASNAAGYGYSRGEYINWQIEEYSSGVWQPLFSSLLDSRREPHPELENKYYRSHGYGYKNVYGSDMDFYSSSWRVRPRKGRRYRINVENKTKCRIALTVGVDGKNTLNSSNVAGSAADAAWVVASYDDVTIEGFQSGNDTAMEFYWTVPENAHSDSLDELGAIEMMVFFEDSSCTRREIFGGSNNSFDGRRSLRAAPDTATGAGDEVDSSVRGVDFRKLTDKPVEIVRVVYSANMSTRAPSLDDNSYGDYTGNDGNSNCFTGIGVYVGNTPYSGAPVTRVIYDSPAWRGGLRSSDRIIKANGENINNYADLKSAIRQLGYGDYMTIEYLRGRNYANTTVRLDTICP